MLKPQDIVMLLKVHLLQGRKWGLQQLAVGLRMSPSEVHAALKRAQAGGCTTRGSVVSVPLR
ncbi:hypothetical protein [Gloeobacter morelensis]|uniref:Transposase n=1 Tax=Gloeobacter morelensis MG652769 TaxID=2781736 RepID=A0ABY3PN03_9CYAN|nr:hypothetical protein [Gloeobacter morelensis]UFP94989.1 hypothetical protein ISF26_01710 [Gloeobacter morelensis MG652769]